jgi:hypothetical protein
MNLQQRTILRLHQVETKITELYERLDGISDLCPHDEQLKNQLIKYKRQMKDIEEDIIFCKSCVINCIASCFCICSHYLLTKIEQKIIKKYPKVD